MTEQLHAVLNTNTGKSMEYKHLIADPSLKPIWTYSCANEFGRLANGVGTRMKHGTNTIVFITKDQVPKGRTVTYTRIVCELRPQKEEVHRTRLTVGGNLIHYPGNVSTPACGLTSAKILFNSVVSTPGAKFCTADIKNFYLNTPMDRYEYMRIHESLVPDEIMDQYDLHNKKHHGWVYMEIRKGMYGLKEAAIL